jgi:hypothetical protein
LFDDLYNLVFNLKEDISSELLISIYSTIESAIINMESSELKEDIDKIHKLKNKLIELKKMEEDQREKENPEDLLNNL